MPFAQGNRMRPTVAKHSFCFLKSSSTGVHGNPGIHDHEACVAGKAGVEGLNRTHLKWPLHMGVGMCL